MSLTPVGATRSLPVAGATETAAGVARRLLLVAGAAEGAPALAAAAAAEGSRARATEAAARRCTGRERWDFAVAAAPSWAAGERRWRAARRRVRAGRAGTRRRRRRRTRRSRWRGWSWTWRSGGGRRGRRGRRRRRRGRRGGRGRSWWPCRRSSQQAWPTRHESPGGLAVARVVGGWLAAVPVPVTGSRRDTRVSGGVDGRTAMLLCTVSRPGSNWTLQIERRRIERWR